SPRPTEEAVELFVAVASCRPRVARHLGSRAAQGDPIEVSPCGASDPRRPLHHLSHRRPPDYADQTGATPDRPRAGDDALLARGERADAGRAHPRAARPPVALHDLLVRGHLLSAPALPG